MGQLEDLHLYITIVEHGSIGKAADALHIAKSAVSRRLGILENRYALTLIDREKGNWQITSAGAELYQRAVELVGDANDLDLDFVQTDHTLSGPLTVSIADEFGLAQLKSSLIEFAAKYPDILLSVDFDNRQVNLARENYDLAVRITERVDAALIEQPLGSSRHHLYASRLYANQHGLPVTLDALTDHPLLHHGFAKRATWKFITEQGDRVIEFQPALNSNSGPFLLQATLEGLGLARLPDFIADTHYKKGDLVHVLPSARISDWTISVVYAPDRRRNRRVRAFVEEIARICDEKFS
jgi:DNA-binding transcriptional LysR family regulator